MKVSLMFMVVHLFFTATCYGQVVVINEFMSDNETVIADEDGDFVDWIELYNKYDVSVNLAGFCLSDDNNNLHKWTFPDVTIAANGFITVFASGKNRLDTTELHTNFKIASSGEELFLSNSEGFLIDQTVEIDLSDDESYGRYPDGSSNWMRSFNSSFNQTNLIFNQLEFSHDAGFYSSPFFLNIASIINDTIFYTLNGNMPSDSSEVFPDSLFMDYQYAAPNVLSEIPTSPPQELITFKAWSLPEEIIDKAIVFRCASFSNGVKTSPVYTQTFIIDSLINAKYDMPVISIVSDFNNFFSPETGIYVPGVNYDTANPEWSGNYFIKDVTWERPVHIEYFDSAGNMGFAQNTGIRIHGGKTRQAAQKSIKLYARSEYGKSWFEYPLLPHRNVNKYKRFVLRATMGAYNGQTIIADALAHDIVRDLDIEYQDFNPVVVFLNGEYWGIHTLMDKTDERYISYLYNIDKDSVIVEELYYGNHFWDLEEIIIDMDFSIEENYEFIDSIIDISNFIDYHIAEMFFANIDWPRSNNRWWREIDPESKWRWIFFDIDAGYLHYNYNMFRHMTLNTGSWPYFPHAALLFRKLFTNEVFVDQFVERYNYLLTNCFNSDITLQKLEDVKQLYQNEMLRHIGRWNFPDSYSSWENDIDINIKAFLENRPQVVVENMNVFISSINNFSKSEEESNFILYPNPNNGVVFIKPIYQKEVKINIEVCDMFGHTIYTENNILIPAYANSKSFQIPVPNSGIYFVKIFDDLNFESYKLIVK